MSFSFRRSNTKEANADLAEDDQSERWQFGFSGINFEEDELEIENAPNWPEAEQDGEEFHSVEQLELAVDFSSSSTFEREESPRPVAIELVDELDNSFAFEMEREEEEVKIISPSFSEPKVVELREEIEVIKVSAPTNHQSDVAPLPVVPVPVYNAANRKILPSDSALSFEQNLRRRFGGNVRSALGPGTVVEGKFRFDEPVRIDGTLTGEVKSSSALIVGEEAMVDGRINVGTLIVLGEVTGPIIAEDLVELKKGARVKGDITTARISIEEGAIYDGEIVTR